VRACNELISLWTFSCRQSLGVRSLSFLSLNFSSSGVLIRPGVFANIDIEFLAFGVVFISPKIPFDALVLPFAAELKLTFFFGDLDELL
jgi:hypothetical protein